MLTWINLMRHRYAESSPMRKCLYGFFVVVIPCVLVLTIISSLLAILFIQSSVVDEIREPAEYAMYVWRDAFNADSEYCHGIYPANETGTNALCFNHSWESLEARSHLWSSCKVSGREVDRIFLSDVVDRILYNGYRSRSGICDANLIATLEEAHALGISVYALFAVSDQAFSEKNFVGLAEEFNRNCGTETGKFDGVSVNNEYFTQIVECTDENQEEQLEFLDNLNETAERASPLPLHFSVSWRWGCELEWSGSTKSALDHMIDTVDSVDVQVAWNVAGTMSRRAQRPYRYWLETKAGTTRTTNFYVLAYTNPNNDCRLSFSPHVRGSNTAFDRCNTGDRTEHGMFAAFDQVKSDMRASKGAIHFMGGIYSSGMPGWPKHEGITIPTRSPTLPPTPAPTPQNKEYGMFVLRDAFNVEAEQCGGVYPSDRSGDNALCFNHSWDSPEARTRLWASCSIPNRNVRRIFLSDVSNRIQNGGFMDRAGTCDRVVIETLEEAHSIGVQVYALFSVGNEAFSEKYAVGLVNEFNSKCGTETGRFDGVAVINKYFSRVRTCAPENIEAQLKFLDDLQETKENAYPLPLHFSVSWHWECCSCSSSNFVSHDLNWNGTTKNTVAHMLDIVDSVDIRASWNLASTMTRRSFRPYQYWEVNKAGDSNTTAFYILANTSPNRDCRFSFSPHARGSLTSTDSCTTGDRSQDGMFDALDEVQSNMTASNGAINFFGGVYSSGLPGWPRHG